LGFYNGGGVKYLPSAGVGINGTKDRLMLYKQMDACNEKVDVRKIPFWPFLGGEQGEYFFSLF